MEIRPYRVKFLFFNLRAVGRLGDVASNWLSVVGIDNFMGR